MLLLVAVAVAVVILSTLEAADPEPTCRPCPATVTGSRARCRLPRGHHGDHEAEVGGQLVHWPNG